MPQCPHCMTEIPPDATICTGCGARQGAAIPKTVIFVGALSLPFILIALNFLFRGDFIGVLVMLPLIAMFLGLAAVLFFVLRGKKSGGQAWYR